VCLGQGELPQGSVAPASADSDAQVCGEHESRCPIGTTAARGCFVEEGAGGVALTRRQFSVVRPSDHTEQRVDNPVVLYDAEPRSSRVRCRPWRVGF
jgi:hypothetical protein